MQKEKKQNYSTTENDISAVDFLVEQLDGERHLTEDEIKRIVKKAKAMEKQKAIEFAKYCLNNAKYLNFDKALFNVEEYYQIFKHK